MNEKYKGYSRSALINELEVYKHAINEGAQRIEERDFRIAELEEENTKLKKDYEFCHNDLRSKIDYIHDQDEVINYYKEENARLFEQLKKVKPPKFKNHQYVYSLCNNEILKGQIDAFDFYEKQYLVHFFGKDEIDCLGDEWCSEDELFAAKTKAQKYLEEHK